MVNSEFIEKDSIDLLFVCSHQFDLQQLNSQFMRKINQIQNENVPQTIFSKTAADCFLLFERYRLKTHIIGINIEKDMIHQCYESLESRLTQRYSKLFQNLQSSLNELQKHFIVAQASSLRALNNIIRNYRRRVGTIGNQPLSNFKYNKFDKSQKMLLESIIYNDRQSYGDLLKFRQQLVISMEQGDKQIQDRYKRNDKIRENYKKILEVVDKTQCYTHKYYDNFQRSMLTTINTLQSNFDKLNGYLTVWENVGSTKAYEIKSMREYELQQKNNQNQNNKKFIQEESQQHLQNLLSSSPPSSTQREQYRKRLNDLRRYHAQKQRKLDMVGKMFNKRKNKAGILVSKNRDLSILDWYFNIEMTRINYSYQDEYKHYNAESDNINNDFKPTGYQLQRPFKRQKIDDIKQHMQKYQTHSILNNQWCYDKYGKQGVFDLIGCVSQLVQSRVQFQCTRQVDLQNIDDRRKRELLQKQHSHIRDSERRQSLHIGFLHVHQKTEMEWLQQRAYDTEYLPQMFAHQKSSSSIEFSDDQQQIDQQNKKSVNKPPLQIVKKQHKASVIVPQKKIIFIQQKHTQQMIPLVTIANQRHQNDVKIDKQSNIKNQEKNQVNILSSDFCLQQQIISTYFRQYSKKVIRKQSEPQYKKSRFVYYPTINQVKWELVKEFFQCQKAFISTKSAIIYFNRVFSTRQQKIKCTVYTLDQDLQEQSIRQKITKSFVDVALVTVKFCPIYTELQSDSHAQFMIGLLFILSKYGQMPEDYQYKHYINVGKEIIQDFNCYYYPQDYRSPLSIFMRKHKPNKPHEVFNSNKKQDKQIITRNQISQTWQAQASVSTQSKNTNSINQITTKVQSNFSKIQYQQKQQSQNMKQQIKNSGKMDINFLNYKRQQNEECLEMPSADRQNKELKRQNSREYLKTADFVMKIAANFGAEVQNQRNEPQDYDTL